MTDEIKIEKGIPIPVRQKGKGGGKFQKAVGAMVPGDSIFLPCVDEKQQRSRATYSGVWGKRYAPKRFTARMVDGGVRIWRIEDAVLTAPIGEPKP